MHTGGSLELTSRRYVFYGVCEDDVEKKPASSEEWIPFSSTLPAESTFFPHTAFVIYLHAGFVRSGFEY